MKAIKEAAKSWLSPHGAVFMALYCLLPLLDGPLFVVALMVLVPVGASVMTLRKDFGMYRKTWEVIASGQVKVDKRMDYCLVLSPLRPTTPDDYVALIKPDENIVLIGGGRLLNSFATYTNPWSLFWYLRIRRRLRRIDSGEHPLQARRADRLSELMG
jgi:hypothetical protein